MVKTAIAKTKFWPRNEYNTLLTVDRLGNIVGGRPITYINVPMSTMKSACIGMLKAGLPIFFGSDVGKYSNSQKGIMDLDLIDYELGFNVKLGMSKGQRLMTGESATRRADDIGGQELSYAEVKAIASGTLDPTTLISHRFDLGDMVKGYETFRTAAEPDG